MDGVPALQWKTGCAHLWEVNAAHSQQRAKNKDSHGEPRTQRPVDGKSLVEETVQPSSAEPVI